MIRKRLRTSVLSGLLAIAVLALGPAASRAEAPPASDALLAKGEAAYQRECAMCHGPEGDGEGPGAHILTPKPRNFELGVFKLRSTPNGEFPTDDDLFRIVTNGIPNSMMPAFRELPEDERWGLVYVVKAFAGIDESAMPVAVPAMPPVTQATLAEGEKIYAKLKCANCHGVEGMADGPSSLTLKDDDKHRIWPTDLTMGVFKGGATPEDLYTRIATGMDGTPMPSYVNEATPDEIWSLVHYLKSLSGG